ncbi:hypothetical protein JD844_004973 [Phrynosoma platyrhinos]|uniref:Centrosomin N-terminal motif 1 domain-containing protein n=1 Tax=Phrynosoma platyrhinos TaxID=52577 RepID=A0ABQ7SDZ6_PHRPL|nr:hypothetical protein JD844_004973 [Phrynosoma platyrhinos]
MPHLFPQQKWRPKRPQQAAQGRRGLSFTTAALLRAASSASPRWRPACRGPLRPFEFGASRQSRDNKSQGHRRRSRSSLLSLSFAAMDSSLPPGEDPTLPLGLNGSVNFSQLPDVSGDEIRVCLAGGGVLPDVAEDAVSPTRARTMKDFENQIIELRKENFNLKLRIYFLEERIQQKFDGSNEDIYRIVGYGMSNLNVVNQDVRDGTGVKMQKGKIRNIELKVELESLKQELQEREQLLIKASKAVESLAQGGDAEIQRLKEEAHKKFQEMEENLTSRINRLEEDLKIAHEEAEKAFAMTERERVLRLTAEQQLSLITNMQPRDLDVMAALKEKDRCIEQQSLSLKNQEALIQSLEEAKSQRRCVEESLLAEKIQECTVALKREKEQELESLQEELREQETELSVEKRNALKRDKTIQGLTLALKTRENENEELSSEIEGLAASLAKAREATHKVQMQKFKGVEDSQVLLLEKESLLADLRSENLTKDTENRKLQRRVKRAEQELSDLRLEREKLVKELEEAQLQKSRSDKTINDLRNQLEKTHDEMIEKEKAMEHHYSVLLSECNQKLQNQELVITRLTDSITQKDELLQKIDGVVKEKDAELQEWFVKFHSLAKDQEMLQKQNEELVRQKSAVLTEQPIFTVYKELEKTKAAEYADMLEALRKERDIFSTLIKSLKEADGLEQKWKRLARMPPLLLPAEQSGFGVSQLRQVSLTPNCPVEQQETISCWSDQTSYMSICLRAGDHLDLQIDNLSMEELKKKVFLESPEASRTLTEGFDDETSMPSSHGPETVSEIIPSDYSDRQCRTLNKPGIKDELAVGAGFPGSVVGEENEAQEMRLVVSLFSENGRAVLESSRQEEMKIANKPLDHLNTTEWDGSSNDLENKDEKDLKRLIIQLRAELKELAQVNKSQKQQLESQSTVAESEGLDRKPLPQINKDIELSKVEVKDTATQTATAEGSVGRLKHEGKIATWEDKAKSSRLNEERRQKRVSTKSKQQETSLRMSKTNKSDLCYPFKKSRLPVRLKSSRSLGSISSDSFPQKPDLRLQHRMFNLDEDLKGRCTQQPQPLNELHPSEVECRPQDQDQMFVEETESNKPEPDVLTSKGPDQDFSLPSKQDVDLATTASMISLKPSCTSLEEFDCDTVNDVKELRQRVKDLMSELAKYHTLMTCVSEPAKELPPSAPLSVVQNHEELPANGHFPPTLGDDKHASQTSEVPQQVEYGIQVEDLTSCLLEEQNEAMVEKLKELLSENEAELEREQIANMHLLDKVYRLQRKLKGVVPDGPDSPISSPAPEDSCHRQKIQESHRICATYRQHLTNLIRAFEELLQASEVDYYIAEGFREQLNRCARLFERLEQQCLYGESIEDEIEDGLAQRLSDLEMSQKPSCLESSSHKEEAAVAKAEGENMAVVPSKFHPELLMEHLQEIRMLRHQLEESIKTNERLRKQLEQQVSDTVQDQGKV